MDCWKHDRIQCLQCHNVCCVRRACSVDGVHVYTACTVYTAYTVYAAYGVNTLYTVYTVSTGVPCKSGYNVLSVHSSYKEYRVYSLYSVYSVYDAYSVYNVFSVYTLYTLRVISFRSGGLLSKKSPYWQHHAEGEVKGVLCCPLARSGSCKNLYDNGKLNTNTHVGPAVRPPVPSAPGRVLGAQLLGMQGPWGAQPINVQRSAGGRRLSITATKTLLQMLKMPIRLDKLKSFATEALVACGFGR